MSALADSLLAQLAGAGLPAPVTEHRFAPPRRWRFDLAWPDRRLAVEVEGGTWIGGRHSRPASYAGDCEKYNAAALHDWKVLRFTTNHIRDGSALATITEALT